jgi:hypothetical protein
MVKGEMTMNQGDGVKKEDRKVGKRRKGVFRRRQHSTLRLFGMRIEHCREPRDEEARLAQILTVSKDREEGMTGRGRTRRPGPSVI